MPRAFVRSVIALVMGAILLSSPSTASAHEHREILGGKYEVVIGWLNEPAISDELNSLDLRVTDLTQATPAADGGEATGAPVDGLEETLTVEIFFVDQTRTLTLEPRWMTPGAYNSWLIPVQPGDYSFRITGTINGEAVDETFTPGPETFSVVEDRATLEFPPASASTTAGIAGSLGGFNDIGRSGLGGLAVGLLGLVAVAGTYQSVRRRATLRPAARASSAGD